MMCMLNFYKENLLVMYVPKQGCMAGMYTGICTFLQENVSKYTFHIHLNIHITGYLLAYRM